MRVDCISFSEKVAPQVHEMVELTEEDGNERGSFMYLDNGKIEVGGIHEGSPTGVSMRPVGSLYRLLTGKRIVGTIHTHPDVVLDTELSVQDMKMLLTEPVDIAVVGFRENGESYMSLFESEGTDNNFERFMHGISGGTGLETIMNGSRKLRTCTVKLWPLN